jgi:hypothetical protein
MFMSKHLAHEPQRSEPAHRDDWISETGEPFREAKDGWFWRLYCRLRGIEY